MNALWTYFWPLFAIGVAVGAIGGSIAFRARRGGGRKRSITLVAGMALSLAAATLWSGPLGATDRLASKIERDARLTLDNYEMTQVTAHLHRSPLSRTLILSGSADDVQRSELVRILRLLSGVRDVSWTNSGGIPLIAESALVTIASFLFGLLLAYLVELRRRYNAQWNW